MPTYHVDQSPEDAAFKKQYLEDVEMLCGLVIEMFGDKPTTLLSPVFREMILKHARSLKGRHGPISDKLFVDNPGKPLKAWEH